MRLLRRIATAVGAWFGPWPYVPILWDVAAASAGVLFAFGRWTVALILLVVAAFAVWRLLALADWAPAARLPESRGAADASAPPASTFAQSRTLLLIFLFFQIVLFWGALEEAGVRREGVEVVQWATVAMFLLRPRWLSVAMRWFLPCGLAVAVVHPPFKEIAWNALTASLFLVFAWIVQRRSGPKLPALRVWLGRFGNP